MKEEFVSQLLAPHKLEMIALKVATKNYSNRKLTADLMILNARIRRKTQILNFNRPWQVIKF
jgi:hypothetical protein